MTEDRTLKKKFIYIYIFFFSLKMTHFELRKTQNCNMSSCGFKSRWGFCWAAGFSRVQRRVSTRLRTENSVTCIKPLTEYPTHTHTLLLLWLHLVTFKETRSPQQSFSLSVRHKNHLSGVKCRSSEHTTPLRRSSDYCGVLFSEPLHELKASLVSEIWAWMRWRSWRPMTSAVCTASVSCEYITNM